MQDSRIRITRKAKARLESLNATPEEVVEHYKTMSMAQIAELLNTDYYVVRMVLLGMGVKLRNKAGSTGSKFIGKPKLKHGLAIYAARNGIAPASFYKIAAILKLGGKCAKCGTSDLRVLQLNHINGEKSELRRTSDKDLNLRIALGEQVDYINLLCANCNCIHEYDRGNRPLLSKVIDKNTGKILPLGEEILLLSEQARAQIGDRSKTYARKLTSRAT